MVSTQKWLTPAEVAELTGCTVKTLTDWRYRGIGPRYVKTAPGRSGRVRYPEGALVAWMKSCEQGGGGEAA